VFKKARVFFGNLFSRQPKNDTEELEKACVRLEKKLKRKLKDFDKGNPSILGGKDDLKCSRPEPEKYPVPELLLFALHNVLEYPAFHNREEKTSWSVFGRLNRTEFIAERRKSGFIFCFAKDANDSDCERIVGQLSGTVPAVKKELAKIASHQIATGNVSVTNRYYEFTNRYRFFRDKAEHAFSEEGFVKDDDENEMTNGIRRIFHRQGVSRDGFYFTVEMIDAFYSRLEHLLLLHYAFLGRFQKDGDLKDFLWSKWDCKFKAILDVDSSHDAGKLLGDLRSIKDAIRNPFAHGGTENDLSSLFFHLPGVGAVPASLNDFKNSQRFNRMIPVEKKDFDNACDVFDKVDAILAEDDLKFAFMMVERGVDAAFDKDSQSKYKEVLASEEKTIAFAEEWNRRADDHANFD